MRVLLDIKDSEAAHVMRVLRSLSHVKAQTISAEKAALIEQGTEITTKDIALGIGRPLTEAELNNYLTETAGGEPKTADEVKRDLRKRIGEQFDSR